MSKRLCVLLIVVLFSVGLALGQRTLSVSATLAPTLSHTTYQQRSFYPESDGQIVEPVFLDGGRWATGYGAGLSVLYTYAPGWSVSSGLWYEQLTTRQARQPLAGEGTVAFQSRFLRIPLLLNYASSTKRLSPYFSVGILADFPITSRVIVTRVGESTQHLRLHPLITRPIFQGLLGAGFHYKLGERCILIGQPVWTYAFGQFGLARFHDTSYAFSLLTQIAYRF